MFHQEAMESTEAMDERMLAEIEKCIHENKDCTTTSLLVRANLEDLFQRALISPQYLCRVQEIVNKLAMHPDFTLRQLLMKKLPRLALLCFVEDKPHFVITSLCPLLLACLNDKNEEVRKACEISLIVLIKGKLLEREILDDKVCPRVVEICKMEAYPSTVALMGKMAPLIGKEATEKHFLETFIQLCSSKQYHTRKKCVKSLGNLSAVLGTETTEKHLLNLFVNLCRDESWEVREFCPEVFIPVSCTCSLTARKTSLADAFADLLKDVVQSVRMSAYLFLGPFICTFADPSVTKLDYDENGELIFVGQDGYKFRIGTVDVNYSRDLQRAEELVDGKEYFDVTKGDHTLSSVSKALRFFVQSEPGQLNLQGINSNQSYLEVADPSTSGMNSTSNDNDWWNQKWNSIDDEEANNLYNTFRFWRVPLDVLDTIETEPEQDDIRNNLKMLDNELSSLSEKLAECSAEDLEEIKTESLISCASSSDSGWNSAETTLQGEAVPSADTKTPYLSQSDIQSSNDTSKVELLEQDVVPQILLDSFVSMTSPLQGEIFEIEMARDCAYCLPAVALTLGPANWPYIRNAYKCLSMNIQWRVRKTVVSSIHKLASMVGEEVASKDLAPIFESFIRDLDEVKIGALEHLADFLKLVQPSTRNAFLPRLKDFLKTEIDYNWRYREEFGEQLRLLIKFYNPPDWLEHFKPLAILLLGDKVAAVREKAVLLFLELLVNLSCEPEYQEKLLCILSKEFAEDTSWRRRQVFVHLCSEIARQKAIDEKKFCQFLLDSLLLLSKDSVPNVGLCVARCLASDVISTGYINSSSPQFKTILDILEELKCDEDSDIRYFASECEQPKEDKI